MAGNLNLAKIKREINKDFDPEEYDKDMNEAFNEEYYEEAD